MNRANEWKIETATGVMMYRARIRTFSMTSTTGIISHEYRALYLIIFRFRLLRRLAVSCGYADIIPGPGSKTIGDI